MKKIILLALVIGASWHFWKKHNEEAVPEEIKNPVYGQLKVSARHSGGSIEMMMFLKTTDETDCKDRLKTFENIPKDICPTCQLETSECKTELMPRYAKLFDNEQTSLTYLSLSRGKQAEREVRLIYWGLTVDQSDKFCGAVPDLKKNLKWKGEVQCILARRG